MAANDGFIEYNAPGALAELKEASTEIVKQIGLIDTLNGKLKGSNTPSGSDAAIKSLNDQLAQQDATIKRLQASYQSLATAQRNNTVIANTTATASGKVTAATREQSVANQILRAETDRNFRANTLLAGAYARASAQLLILKKNAKDAAITFGEESVQAQKAAKAASDLNGRILAADKSVGDFQRNVGNYSGGLVGGFKAIFSSVRQLAYILPGIGIAGIFDLAFTAIGNALDGLDLFNKKITDTRNAINQTNEASNQGLKTSIDEIVKLKALLATAADDSLPLKDRKIALDEILKQYPYYFKALGEEKILAGETADAERSLTDALIARARGQAAVSKITENESKIIDLEERRVSLTKELAKAEKDAAIAAKQTSGSVSGGTATGGGGQYDSRLAAAQRVADLQRILAKNQKELNTLNEANNRLTGYAINQTEKSIGLYEKENKVRGLGADRSAEAENNAKIRFLKAYNDALKASDEERKSLLEGETNDLNKIAINEKENFFKRLEAYGEMQQKKAELAAMSNDAEMLRISNQTDLELAEAEKAEQRELRQAAKNAEARNTITKYYEAERAAILLKSDKQRQIQAEKSKQEYIKIAEDAAKAELDIIHKRDEILLSTEKIYRDQQMDLFKKVADNEKLTVNIRQEAFRTYIALKQKQLDIDKAAAIAAAGNNQEEIDNIRAKYAVVQELLNTEKENASPFAKSLERANAELEKIKANLTDKAFSGVGLSSLKQFFDGTFKSVMDGFDMIEDENERFLKKFQYTFDAAASIVSDAMAFIENAERQQVESRLARLDRSEKIALAFYGQTAEGRAEIERQYDEKQRQIKRRQAIQEKRFAEFQIIVETARAVVSALPNLLLAGIVGGLGIAQLAYVAAQPLPEFYKGTDNAPGGYAWTQEKGRELITDKSGRIKSTGSDKGAALTKLDKGDKVYTAEQTAAILFNKQLDAMLFNNGIGGLADTFASPNFKGSSNSLTPEQVEQAMRNAIQSMPVGDVIEEKRDDLGYTRYKMKASQRIEQTNNQKYMRGTTFKR